MPKSSKSTQLVYESKEVDGTPAFNTSNVSGKKYVYGDFSNLAIGVWNSGIDIICDPYTLAGENMIKIICHFYVDSKLLRPEAFTTGTLA